MARRGDRLRGGRLLNRIAALAVVAGCATASGPGGGEPAVLETGGSLADEHAPARAVLLAAINADRIRAGAPPVVFDSLATRVAQDHARAMAVAGFLSHYGSMGEAPYERYAAVGGRAHVRENVFQWRVSGVNEDHQDAGPRFDLERVHDLLMGSSGHRATILDPHRTHVGIGVAHDAEGRALVVVEDFLARHAMIDVPRMAWRGSPTVLRGRIVERETRPLLVVLSREPAVRDWVARGDPPPDGPYLDGSRGEVILLPPWQIVQRRDGTFEAELPIRRALAGRFYGVLYVAPARVVERALDRGRVSTESGWPAAAFVIELL